jgi:hypothetical protein
MPADDRTRAARGRPAVSAGERSTPICVTVGDSDFKRVYDRAQRERTSMPAVVRQAITNWLDDDRDD